MFQAIIIMSLKVSIIVYVFSKNLNIKKILNK